MDNNVTIKIEPGTVIINRAEYEILIRIAEKH